jgi:itaconyl-CoA hydratase
MANFPSHEEIAPNEYVEIIGIDLDGFSEGMVIEHRPGFTFYERDSIERARISGDHTPSAMDPGVMAAAGGGAGEILQTWIVGSLASMTTRVFGRVTANLGWENISFENPTRDGDTMFAETTILDKRDSKSRPTQGILHVKTRGVTRGGGEICQFERRLLVYRGAQEPHKKAGYV